MRPALPGIAMMGLCLPACAAAQQSQATSQERPDDDIVVKAERGAHSLIDRETYVIRDTPLAQSRTAVEVIQNLPSVSIDSSGKLRLLGNRNVKILIDGRDVPNAEAMLATLQASQIARVEVMTNPSAQFSAYGSGGVINVILRRSFADGLAGSAGAALGKPGYFNGRLSPTWSKGNWSVSASPSLTLTRNRLDRTMERTSAAADPAIDRIEDDVSHGSGFAASVTTQVSFKPSATKRYDLTASANRSQGEADHIVQIASPLAAFAPFVETSSGKGGIDSASVSLERTARGRKEGEELKLSLSWSHYLLSSRASYVDLLAGGSRAFAVASSVDDGAGGAKADYTTPVGSAATLSLGAELQLESQHIRDTASGVLASGPVHTSDSFRGHWRDMSAYATFQMKLGPFKILPGLRVQHRRFEFDGASGLAPVRDTLFFPTLHLERSFGKLTTTFSITRRADWPGIGNFSPYRRITGPTTADTGNPALRPEQSRGIEAGARLSIAGQQLSLTLYDRRRSHVRDTTITVAANGAIEETPVNTGTRSSRGGQLSIRGKLLSSVRYSGSAWLADARFDRLEGIAVVRDSAREFGANAQLEYASGKQGERGFDQVTLNVKYFGPTRSSQSETGGLLGLDLAYTHYLTDRLSIVSTLNRLAGSRTITARRASPLFAERTVAELEGPTFRFSLVYKLGK